MALIVARCGCGRMYQCFEKGGDFDRTVELAACPTCDDWDVRHPDALRTCRNWVTQHGAKELVMVGGT